MIDEETAVRDLLEHAAQSSPAPPLWTADLGRRASRRRSSRAFGAVLATAAILAGATAVGVTVAHRPGAGPALEISGPGVPEGALMVRIEAAATANAAIFAGSWQTSNRQALYVTTPQVAAHDLDLLGLHGQQPSRPGAGYLVEVFGNYNCTFCDSNFGGGLHSTHVLFSWVSLNPTNPDTSQFFGGVTHAHELASIGPAFAVPQPPTTLTALHISLISGKPGRPVAGTAQVRNGDGRLVDTVSVPSDGRQTVLVTPGTRYTVTATDAAGAPCDPPTEPADHIVVVGGRPGFAEVYCPAS
jgi:hypothetical protein